MIANYNTVVPPYTVHIGGMKNAWYSRTSEYRTSQYRKPPNTGIQISVPNTGIYSTDTTNPPSEYREPLDTRNISCLPTHPGIRISEVLLPYRYTRYIEVHFTNKMTTDVIFSMDLVAGPVVSYLDIYRASIHRVPWYTVH